MRLTFWELVAMAVFILLSSSSYVKADPDENSGETAAWANSFCQSTWYFRHAMQSHLHSLHQELHGRMQQFDLDLAGYIQSTFCFAEEQTAESVTRDLRYVWEGLTCLNSTLQNILSKSVHRRQLNDVIKDVKTLAVVAGGSTDLRHLLRADDCSLWRNYSEHFLHLSYSFVNRSLTLAHDLINLCRSVLN